MRRGIVAAFVVAIVAAPRIASVARAPDISKQSFEYRGDAARALTTLLALPLDCPTTTTLTFEQSQSAEHRALPERDAALRDPQGFLPSDLDWRTSTMVRETVTWDPRGPRLTLDGHVSDLSSAIPHGDGPQWSFSSPGFAQKDVLPGWRAVVGKLLTVMPVKYGTTDRRSIEIEVGNERARAMLDRIDTWDAHNQPVEMWIATISFGPMIAGMNPDVPAAKPRGGCSH